MLLSNPFKPDPRVYKEAKTLSHNGYEIVIFAWDREGGFKKNEEINGIEIKRIQIISKYGTGLKQIFKLLLFWMRTYQFLRKEDFEIVHCHDFDTLPIGVIVSEIFRKKIFFDVHDFYFTHFLQRRGLNKFFGYLIKGLEKILVKRVDGLIAATPGLSRYYDKIISSNTPMEVIYNFAEKSHFNKIKREAIKEFTISYIGSVRYPKQLINLFEATRDLVGVKVLVVGGGIDLFRIAQVALNYKQVDLHESVPYEDIPKFYERSNVIYAVSDASSLNVKVTYPIKVFEAMICGLPVIVNRGTDAGEFVESNKIGFIVNGNNINEIRKLVSQLKNNPGLCQETGKNAKNLAERKYCWENISGKLIDFYNKSLRNKSFCLLIS